MASKNLLIGIVSLTTMFQETVKLNYSNAQILIILLKILYIKDTIFTDRNLVINNITMLI